MGVIGRPIDRRDGRAKITGTARYAAEFSVKDMTYAILVQSTIAAGTISAIDTTEASAMPGVLTVITPDNALRLTLDKSSPQTVTGPLLQDHVVAYNGQHVAVVVADTLEHAQAAAPKVRVTYQPAPWLAVMDDALDQAYRPKHFRNGTRDPDSSRGDADAAFAAAPVRHEATYTTPVENHNPMEPHATIARWEGDRLTVWHTTQGIGGTQKTLAGMFAIKPEQVHVIDPYVGGGFGCKGNCWPPAVLAAMAARMVSRPVKLELTRAQMFTSNGYRPYTVQTVRLGADSDGRITALRHDTISQMSRGDYGEFTEPCGLGSEMLYAVPNAAITHRLAAVNQGFPTYMRAPGEASGVFALESAMDELAVALNMDPLELRLLNYAEKDWHENKPFSAKKLRECYQVGAEMFGWHLRSPKPASMRDGRMLVGYGMATSTYPMNRSPAHARVRLDAEGIATVQAASQDIGTGTYTVMTQVSADVLGLPVTRVRVELGNSAFPPAPVSGGSMTVASLGPAVQAAAQAVREKLFGMAGQLWQSASADPMRLEDGVVVGSGGRVTVAELLGRNGLNFVDATVEAKPGDEKQHFSLHSFGAQFCEVRVDPDLGEIRVARWVGVFDCGRVMNAKTARSQLIGGITFGIGMALLEETLVDPHVARIVNPNVAEYLMPVNADIPDIQTYLVPNDDPVSNPLGARGLGELPMVGVAPAIANAVYNATGRRVRRVPIRIEDVLV